MRINPLQQSDVVASYMTTAAKLAPETKQAQSFGNDSVELSSGAREYAQLVRAAREEMDAAEVQETRRADEIAKQINAGTYSVSTDDVAQAIVGSVNVSMLG